jgi:DNA-binding response OmpR family regulator
MKRKVTKNSPRIMIVDENIDTIISLRTALELHGFATDAFSDPEKALESFSFKQYDIVISCIKMRNLSRFEFARRIDNLDKNTKIILMTSFHMTKEEFERVMPSTRVDAFIKKPVGMTRVMDHINALMTNDKEFKWSSVTVFLGSIGIASTNLAFEESLPLIL